MPADPPRERRRDARTQLAVLHERVEVLAENLGRFDQGHLGTDRAVGPDFQRQLVVVGLLADARLFDLVADADDRAEHGVDRNDADLLHVRAVLGGRHVAAAVLDHHLDHERHVVGQRGDDVVAVDHLDRFVGLHVGAGHHAALVALDADDLGRFAVVLDDQRLDVEHDVGHVFDHAGQRGELVLRALDLDLRDRTAFQAGKQNPPQAVADGRAEAALERFGDELAVGRRSSDLVIANHRAGKFQPTPSNMHMTRPPIKQAGSDEPIDRNRSCLAPRSPRGRLSRDRDTSPTRLLRLLRAQLDDQIRLHRNRNVFRRRQAQRRAPRESGRRFG